jgi:hypothetical protein
MSSAVRAEIFYCSLTEAFAVGDDGRLEQSEIRKEILKSQLVVNRDTGSMMHPFFATEYYPTVDVVDFGSSGSSFKVVAISSEGSPVKNGEAPFRNMLVLQIGVYSPLPEKPMVLLADTTLVLGNCQ